MQGNVGLAKAIKAVGELYEASWQRQYDKTLRDCIIEVVGPDDPIALVLACLFTAGYSEMWDFVVQGLRRTKMLKPIWPGVKTLLLATVCIAATPTHDAYANRMCCPSRASVIMPDDECAWGGARPRLCRKWSDVDIR